MSLDYNKSLIHNARELRKNLTPHERKIWYDFLSSYPVRFQRQKVIDNYIADFYCAKAKLVIELDGGGHFEPDQMAYDEIRTGVLQKYGLTVLRFTNLEIDRNFYEVCSVIDLAVSEKWPPSSEGAKDRTRLLPPSDEGGGAKRRKE
jgi:very-short-patch-repair endonuclease